MTPRVGLLALLMQGVAAAALAQTPSPWVSLASNPNAPAATAAQIDAFEATKLDATSGIATGLTVNGGTMTSVTLNAPAVSGGTLTGVTLDSTSTINSIPVSSLVTQAQLQAAITSALASVTTTPTTPTSPIVTTPKLNPNWLWRSGLKCGVDLERTAAANPLLAASSITSAAAAGMTHMGITIPYSPDLDFLNLLPTPKVYPVPVFTDAQITPYFQTAQAIIAAGMKVRINFLDVDDNTDVTTWETQIKAHAANCIRLLKTFNFDPAKIAVSLFSEMAGQNNTFWSPEVFDYYVWFQPQVPTFPITLGGASWNYYTSETAASGFLIPPAMLTQAVVEVHTYDTFYTLSQWQSVATIMTQIQTETGCPIYIGEIGLYNVNGGSGPYNETGFIAGLGILPAAFNNFGFTIWSVSDQKGSGPINQSSTVGTFTPAMALNIAAANARMSGAPSALGVVAAVPVFEALVFGPIAQVESGGVATATITLSNLAIGQVPALSFWLDANSTPIVPTTLTNTATTPTSQTFSMTFSGIGDGIHYIIAEDTGNVNAGQAVSPQFGVGIQTVAASLETPTSLTSILDISATGGLKKAFWAIFNRSTSTAYGPFVEADLTMTGTSGAWKGSITAHSLTTDYVAVVGNNNTYAPSSFVSFGAGATAATTGTTTGGPNGPLTANTPNASAVITGLTVTWVDPPTIVTSGDKRILQITATNGSAAAGAEVWWQTFSQNGGAWGAYTASGMTGYLDANGMLQVRMHFYNAGDYCQAVCTSSGGAPISKSAAVSVVAQGTVTLISVAMASTTIAGAGGTGTITVACGFSAATGTVYYQVVSGGVAGEISGVLLDATGAGSVMPAFQSTGDYCQFSKAMTMTNPVAAPAVTVVASS